MSDSEAARRWGEAQRWFAIAEEDLRAARLCLAVTPPITGIAAYHCQQAAEKLVKGLLVADGRPFRKIHDLDALAEQAVTAYRPLRADLDFCRPLTAWSNLFRYPPLGEEEVKGPTDAEIATAVDRLAKFREAIRLIEP